MDNASQKTFEKIAEIMRQYPSIKAVPTEMDNNLPDKIKNIYNNMVSINQQKYFEYKVLGNKEDKILLILPAVDDKYPYHNPGEILNDSRLGENLVKRLADTWNITPDDINRWFTFIQS